MGKFIYYYSVDEPCEESDFSFECGFEPEHSDWIAEEAAEHFHDNYDGWESSWPLIFFIYNANGKFLFKRSVDRDSAPVFNASEVRNEK